MYIHPNTANRVCFSQRARLGFTVAYTQLIKALNNEVSYFCGDFWCMTRPPQSSGCGAEIQRGHNEKLTLISLSDIIDYFSTEHAFHKFSQSFTEIFCDVISHGS